MNSLKSIFFQSVFIFFVLISNSLQAAGFDQQHSLWDKLLKKHVVNIEHGHASQVDYAGFKQDAAELDAYLNALTAVTSEDFASFSQPQKLAFLINAYNAFTVKLILTEYPNLKSIRDLGNILRSPWKKEFFSLLGEAHNLDWIEHEMLRKPGFFDEPRVHFAVNCASIGCPKLATEAYQADRIDAQLNQSMQNFLQDRSRNYYQSNTNTLHVSKIFDWFDGDFDRKYTSIKIFFSQNINYLVDSDADKAKFLKNDYRISYLDYDWNLNALKPTETQSDNSDRAR